MAWGVSGSMGVDDLARRLQSNDPQLQSLTIMKNRRLGLEVTAP